MATRKATVAAAAAAAVMASSSAAAKPPEQDSEARRFFSGANRRLEAPATVADIVQVLEHLGTGGAPTSRGKPEESDD